MSTTVYDKAAWHIDEGEDVKQVLAHFSFIMSWSLDNKLLSGKGLEIAELGVDDSISLNSKMFTEKGNLFMQKYYDYFIAVTDDDDNEMINKLKLL